MKVLIVQHIGREGPGLLEVELKAQGIGYTIIDLSQGDCLPSVANYRAVVVLGGPESANDKNKIMKDELAWIRKIIATRIPYLGICLGLQTLVKAAGGDVVKAPIPEVGFTDPEGHNFMVALTNEGARDPLFKGLGALFPVFHLHGETVELADHMRLLAVGTLCRNQIVKVGEQAYGLQCHFELTSAMLKRWIEEDPLLRNDKKKLQASFRAIQQKYTAIGGQLFKNFLSIAGF